MPCGERIDILQISTRDVGGGAEKVAWDLCRTFRKLGHNARMAVGYKHSDQSWVTLIPNEHVGRVRSRTAWRMHRQLQPFYQRSRMARYACRLAHAVAEPGSVIDRLRGLEDFRYPGTHQLLDAALPDIVHAHNLHGNYFDLRALAQMSRRCPVVMTLHDVWLLSGHCAHSLDCDRWRQGCGQCPDLNLYPAVRRDATALNWKRKQAIYQQCQLHVATPCQWLMRKVESSMLTPAIADARIIPYGVDLSIFRPGVKAAARASLGIDPKAYVLLSAASSLSTNMWKDYATIRDAISRVWERGRGRRVLFLALGDTRVTEHIGHTTIQFVPFINEPKTMAAYYQAADVYVHAAKADTFPCTVLEALACGTPVVATAVGGIPEQVKTLRATDTPNHPSVIQVDAASATGILVDARDAEALARGITRLMEDNLRRRIGENAARDAAVRFDLQRHAAEYLRWYADILERAGCETRVPELGEPGRNDSSLPQGPQTDLAETI